MSPQRTMTYIADVTREVEAHESLQQDIVRYCSPVLAGIRPAALFSCPRTLKPRDQIATPVVQVHMEDEFASALRSCQRALEPHGVHIRILAQREHSVMLYVYRPDLAAAALQQAQAAENLSALGYQPNDLQAALSELAARLEAFDNIDRQRDFWDFPHEMGYFLGYPAPDVMAYTRNRARGYAAYGTWHVYGCKKRARKAMERFDAHAECTQAYWRLYLDGATLGQLAALGTLRVD